MTRTYTPALMKSDVNVNESVHLPLVFISHRFSISREMEHLPVPAYGHAHVRDVVAVLGRPLDKFLLACLGSRSLPCSRALYPLYHFPFFRLPQSLPIGSRN